MRRNCTIIYQQKSTPNNITFLYNIKTKRDFLILAIDLQKEPGSVVDVNKIAISVYIARTKTIAFNSEFISPYQRLCFSTGTASTNLKTKNINLRNYLKRNKSQSTSQVYALY